MTMTHVDDRLTLNIWKDPVVERVGFDSCGDYVELFWLPIIGPTSTWLLRRLTAMAVLHPEGCALDAAAVAASIGLGFDAGPKSSLTRSLQRLSIFGLARISSRTISVRTVVPPLTMKNLSRLPEHLQSAHSLWSDSDPSDAYDFAYSAAAGSTEPELTSLVS